MNRIKFTIVLVIVSGMLHSQNAKDDLMQLNKAYNSLNKLTYTSKYTMYGFSNEKVLETYQFQYKKNANEFVTKSKDEDFIVNKLFVIIVDNESKEIRVMKNTSKKDDPLQKIINDKTNFPLYMDTLMSVYKSINPIKASSPDVRAYKFELINAPYSFVDMYIDVKKWLVKEIYLYPRETTKINGLETAVKLKIEFLNYNLNPLFTNDFSESKYLDKINGKYKLKQSYSSYKLYDKTL